jgi:hypothetical protein
MQTAVINHHGVTPVYVHAVWKLTVPPRVQFFLWLLSKSKLLRREVSHNTCLFCSEPETIHHLFFGCCIAQALWAILSDSLDLIGIWSFEQQKAFANKYVTFCCSLVLMEVTK